MSKGIYEPSFGGKIPPKLTILLDANKVVWVDIDMGTGRGDGALRRAHKWFSIKPAGYPLGIVVEAVFYWKPESVELGEQIRYRRCRTVRR